jgi:hypothetical protein
VKGKKNNKKKRQKKPKPMKPLKNSFVHRLNPEWVWKFWHDVYIQLVMIQPMHCSPMVVHDNCEEDDEAPKELLVLQVKVWCQQFNWEQCFTQRMASSLY